MPRLKLLALGCCLTLCSVFGVTQSLLAAEAASGIRIVEPWSRATPPVAGNGVVYMELVSAARDRLLSASTPVAERVEIHEVSMDDGIMRMRPLEALDLEAGKPVKLAPQSTHIMLIGLHAPLKAGDEFALTLRFEQAGEVQVKVPVRAATK